VTIKTNKHGVVMPFGILPRGIMELMIKEGPTVTRMLLEMHIECLEHSGKNNGKIIHTYDDFVRNGTSRKDVKPYLMRLVWLGIIKKRSGRPGVGGYERPHLFELTYLPTWIGKKWIPATNEWLLQPEKRASQKKSRSSQKGTTARSAPRGTTGVKKTANGQNSTSARKIWKSMVVKRELLSRSMLTKPSPDTQARERTPSSLQTPSAAGANGGANGEQRGKIPWTTPRLVEIEVTPEERAALERSPAFVQPGDVALVPGDYAPQRVYKGAGA
jgi:hypothetical protein